jgi:hypothetical protein
MYAYFIPVNVMMKNLAELFEVVSAKLPGYRFRDSVGQSVRMA